MDNNKGSSRGMTRRQALSLGGVIAAGAAAAGLAGCSGAGSGGTSTHWDKEADVVIIGSGTGAYTAMRCADDGLDVVVLEKKGTEGGSTALSSSVVWAPCNYVAQGEGIEDSREEALDYIEALTGDTHLPEIAEAFVDNVNAAVENSRDMAGVQWKLWPAGIDYCCYLPGGKTVGRSILPSVEEGRATMGAFSGPVMKAAKERGAVFMTETPAERFITRELDDGTVEVLGVRARRLGKEYNIKARRAVVLASGGFDWNDNMLKSYLRTPARYSWGVNTDTGDGHVMAMRIGAQMRLMNEAYLSAGYKYEHEKAKENGSAQLSMLIRDDAKRGIIFVNKHGKRFTNECCNYDNVGKSFCCIENDGENRSWKNLPAWAVIDQAAADGHPFDVGEKGKPGPSYKKYDTLEELAKDCGIDVDGFLAEIAHYNENAEKGLDPDFGRGQDYYGQNSIYTSTDYDGPFRTLQPISTPPYYAAEIVPVMLGTMGGVATNGRAEALDNEGNVIKRLYVQGNASGNGPGGAGYVGGGGTIGPGIAFGEVAANQIKELGSWG